MYKKDNFSIRPPEKKWSKKREYEHKAITKQEGKLIFGEKKATIETKEGEIYYVFETRARGYIHGDIVSFEITRKGGDGKLPEARPIRMIRRSEESLIMEVQRVKSGKMKYKILDTFGGLDVEVENPPKDPKEDDLYLVRYRGMKHVEVIELFGNKKDPETIEMIILFRYSIRTFWPGEFEALKVKSLIVSLQDQIDFFLGQRPLPDSLKLRETDIFPRVKIFDRERLDMRNWQTMTIDGSDAKDLDDAISIARYEGGDYLLGIHIADVAEYVIEGSILDREALARGTSVYTPGRVIPMLPEILSNDRCSLHPGEPKATLSIVLRIDSVGHVRESFVTESLIESRKKGIYDDIWKEMEQKKDTTIEEFSGLYHILEARRKKEGKITFETTECYFYVDDHRMPTKIMKRERNDAHMMIEEFMVLANEEVAKWCVKMKIPFLSRVHEKPGTDQTKIISEILENQALIDTLEPRHIRDHLEQARDPIERYRLSRLLLPKMSKAVYGDTPKGHFGLALSYYAHFTSPIRRYPDLLLHRVIKSHLHDTFTSSEKSRYTSEMKRYGKMLSEREKKAESVERAIDSLMMCRYMSDKVGYEFQGIVSGLTESNIYIELESGIEGSIFLGKNSTSYALDPIQGALVDRKGAQVYRIGDSLRVKIREVNMETRRIEMSEVTKNSMESFG